MAVILNSEHKVHTHLFNPLQHGDKDTDCSEDVEQHRVSQVRALDCAPTMANMKRDEGSYGKRFVTGPGQKQVHPIHIITCAYRPTATFSHPTIIQNTNQWTTVPPHHTTATVMGPPTAATETASKQPTIVQTIER
eukprot:311405_1